MERTDEVIYQRAAEEHIRRPPLWHDDEVDSVRVSLDFYSFIPNQYRCRLLQESVQVFCLRVTTCMSQSDYKKSYVTYTCTCIWIV